MLHTPPMPLLERRPPRLALASRKSRIEPRCQACEPGHEVLKVLAVSISPTARCGKCHRSLRPGEQFWAVFEEKL